MTYNARSGQLLDALREQPPLVQCITNYVAMNVAANVLLAAGASPAMVHAEEEAGEFAGIAGALTVNIGTLSPGWIGGMLAAARAAAKAGKPWVLDPVAHFATAYRRGVVAELLALGPTIVRGNASEIIALAGGQSAGQGVDSGDPVEQAEASATALAQRHRMVVAVTGETDFVTDGAARGAHFRRLAADAAGYRARLLADLPCRGLRRGRARRPLRGDGCGAGDVCGGRRAGRRWCVRAGLVRLAVSRCAGGARRCRSRGRGTDRGRLMRFDLSLYLVLDPGLCAEAGMVETARAAVAGGVTMVQLRDKHATTAARIEAGRALKAALASTGALADRQ